MAALAHLNTTEQQAVAQGLAAYARALAARHPGASETAPAPIEIVAGYRPGWIGRVAEMHAAHYSRHWGFGQFFESTVASGAAEFTGRLDHPRNQAWAAIHDGRIVGSIAIDGEDLGDNQAHLRWFIMDPALRGRGLGRRWLDEAIAQARRIGAPQRQLWARAGLGAAAHLCGAAGFVLTEEVVADQWGRSVAERRLALPLRPNGRHERR